MSILIKGLNMPKSCDECFAELYSWCGIAQKPISDITLRPQNCPLIELPPHGRLIDADALMKDGWKLFKQVGSSVHEMPLNNPSIPIIIEAEVDDG